MIDARVQDAVKQHIQKMDWLHGEGVEALQVKTPSPKQAGTGGIDGKMGFILPHAKAPLAHEVIAPVVDSINQEILPLAKAPLTQEVIAPVVESINQEILPLAEAPVTLEATAPVDINQESSIQQEMAPPTLTTVDLSEESKSVAVPPVDQVTEDGVKAESVGEPAAASTPREKENESKTVSPPPKDGTPV